MAHVVFVNILLFSSAVVVLTCIMFIFHVRFRVVAFVAVAAIVLKHI